MLAKSAKLCLALLLGAGVSAAQRSEAVQKANQPNATQVNCAGFFGDQKVGGDTYLVSGEESSIKLTWTVGEYVHINRGMNQGVKQGDLYTVTRVESDPNKVMWFKWQPKLLKAMGSPYLDLGQVKIVSVQPKVSVAQVIFSCGYMQRGDILVPYQERPAPPLKGSVTFDHFAPVSGKPVAMLVAGKDYSQAYGKLSPVYVNLGTNQGLKVGDYLRIFRYQGSMAETVPQEKGYAYTMYGFGSAPARYEWNDLPREVVGEGIVINVSRNSSTMIVTVSSIETFAGDYVEIE